MTSSSINISVDQLRPFEPTGLGSLHPRFRTLVKSLKGRRQTDIAATLKAEAEAVELQAEATEEWAFATTLRVLRDYVNAGYYPLPVGHRFLLAPVLDSLALGDRERRRVLRQLFEASRNRALQEKDQVGWLGDALKTLRASSYAAADLLDQLSADAPEITLAKANSQSRGLEERVLWRAVRATWSMNPEASSPGREVSFVAIDRRWPSTPLGILQFRNIVPGIKVRDEWMGVRVGEIGADGQPSTGYLRFLTVVSAKAAAERISATAAVFQGLLDNVRTDGLPELRLDCSEIDSLAGIVSATKAKYQQARQQGTESRPLLFQIKRLETAHELLKGISAARQLVGCEDPVRELATNAEVRKGFDAGLRKLWHYHMGFVALELSVCGAAPPFGSIRAGKLMASLAASETVAEAWGRDRPLGDISAQVYKPRVREQVPNPGPLVVFTSGLYPGHSAQYNRVSVGGRRMKKIGNTTGWGLANISPDTVVAIQRYNLAADGYSHVTRSFGEGAGPNFRAVGRALNRLGLPDLRRHEFNRPLYALPYVDRPQEVVLGWSEPRQVQLPSEEEIAREWWERWFLPQRERLVARAREGDDLVSRVGGIVSVLGEATTQPDAFVEAANDRHAV